LDLRLPAFCLLFLFRHCERSEAIQFGASAKLASKPICVSVLDCFVASLLAMTGKTRARIAPRERICHSGARHRREPGIHNHGAAALFAAIVLRWQRRWIAALALRARPE
jgi:hypothetical protein